MGVGFGLAGLAVLAGAALARDLGLGWLVLEGMLVGAVVAIVACGFVALRGVHARLSVVRGWTTIGVGVLVLLTLFLALD
jgi:hypothetical protein